MDFKQITLNKRKRNVKFSLNCCMNAHGNWYDSLQQNSDISSFKISVIGSGLVTFAAAACCTGISFTRIALRLLKQAAACGFTVDLHIVISCWSCDDSTRDRILRCDWSCTVQSVTTKEVTRPLPSLAEWGVATRDEAEPASSLLCLPPIQSSIDFSWAAEPDICQPVTRSFRVPDTESNLCCGWLYH